MYKFLKITPALSSLLHHLGNHTESFRPRWHVERSLRADVLYRSSKLDSGRECIRVEVI